MSSDSHRFLKPDIPPASRPETRIAFRPLAPKAPESTSRPVAIRSHSTSVTQRLLTTPVRRDRCHVCFRLHCILVSHKLFTGTQRRVSPDHNLRLHASADHHEFAFISSYAYYTIQTSETGRNTVSPMLDFGLPVPSEFDTTETRRLFHNCKTK